MAANENQATFRAVNVAVALTLRNHVIFHHMLTAGHNGTGHLFSRQTFGGPLVATKTLASGMVLYGRLILQ